MRSDRVEDPVQCWVWDGLGADWRDHGAGISEPAFELVLVLGLCPMGRNIKAAVSSLYLKGGVIVWSREFLRMHAPRLMGVRAQVILCDPLSSLSVADSPLGSVWLSPWPCLCTSSHFPPPTNCFLQMPFASSPEGFDLRHLWLWLTLAPSPSGWVRARVC